MQYRYETHCHTRQTSRCGKADAADQVDFYKAQGYTGLCVTDHFLNGNTWVPQTGRWEDRIEAFCAGWRAAAARGKEVGLDVFFGWEYSFRGTDILTYGLDETWLLAHPEVMELTMPEYCDFVRAEGGVAIHAHPFREADYIDMIRLIPRQVDGVEVFNANRTDFENERAKEYADNYGLWHWAGSDNHVGLQARLAAVVSEKRVKDMHELCALAARGQVRLEERLPVQA